MNKPRKNRLRRKTHTARNPDSASKSRGEVAKVILGVLAATTIVAVGLTLPGLAHLVPSSYRKRYSGHAIRKAIHALDKNGCLVLRETTRGWKVKLTQKGYAEYSAFELGRKGIPKPKTWDGKWHLLIFDIPEKQRYIRDKIRGFLKGLGFVRLQDSVWTYPYPCKEVLELLRTRYQIRGQALYVKAEWIDHDAWLRKDFHLNVTKKYDSLF